MYVPFIVDIIIVFLFVACLHWHYGNWRKHQIVVTIVTFVSWYFPFMIIFVMPIDVSVRSYKQCLHDHNLVPTTTGFPIQFSTILNDPTFLMKNDIVTNIIKRDILDNDTTVFSSLSLPTSSNFSYTTSDSYFSCEKPISYIPDNTLSIFWHIVYWTSQSLTWIILPLMQSYSKAGEFTFMGKMKYALIVNAIYYGTYLVIFACCLIYLAATGRLKFEISQLKVLAITASNTWGLTLLVLLLGYGLVEVPRYCWNISKMEYMLARLRFKVSKLTNEKIEAEEALEDVVAEVKKMIELNGQEGPLYKYITIIIAKCPEAFKNVEGSRAAFDRLPSGENHITEKSLVKLHRRLIVAMQQSSCAKCLWNSAVEQAIVLEDMVENSAILSRYFKRSTGPYDGIFKLCYTPTIEWYWKCRFRPVLLKGVALVFVIFSITVVWSECLFFIREPVLSIFALFMQLTTQNYNYFAIAIVSVFTISYLSVCTYYTIFKLRIFNYYYLVGPHETDENSMIFCGMLLCRLTPPLCLNFLGLIHLDSHITKDPNIVETAYTGFMGHMDILPFISDGFNIYFPIAIVILCMLTFFGIGTRLLHCIGFQQFIGDDNMTQDIIEEGAELVKREQRKRMRQEDAESRRRTMDLGFQDSNRRTNTGNLRGRTGHDRSELLNDAEPMGYRSNEDQSISAVNDLYQPSSGPTGFSGLYQTDSSTKPQYYSDQHGFGSTNTRPTSRNKPNKNIFEDI